MNDDQKQAACMVTDAAMPLANTVSGFLTQIAKLAAEGTDHAMQDLRPDFVLILIPKGLEQDSPAVMVSTVPFDQLEAVLKPTIDHARRESAERATKGGTGSQATH